MDLCPTQKAAPSHAGLWPSRRTNWPPSRSNCACPRKTLPACSISRCANCPRRRATRPLSTACSPPSTRHGIDTSIHRTLQALASSPRPHEARPRLCRPAIIVLIGGRAGTREIAAAQSMRARGPAGKLGTQGIGDSGTDLAWRSCRPAFEDETLPLTISLGRGAVGKA